MEPDLKNLDRTVAHYWPTPSKEEIEADGNRVLGELRTGRPGRLQEQVVWESVPRFPSRWRLIALLPAAAAVIFAVLLGMRFMPQSEVFAVVENVGGGLYQILDGDGDRTRSLRAGETLKNGEVFRSNGDAAAVFALADGSRVEMRSKSELALESAADGVVLELRGGSIIVTAAKQHKGHLYVKTRDVTVSVVGTVFLVNAEESGSRVAVIEGEVRVQQGSTAKKLLPGEQATSNPQMQSQRVSEEISWSRNAEAHLALLQLAAVTAPEPAQDPETFEVDSVRPSPPPPIGGRGGPGGRAGGGGLCNNPVIPLRFQLDPRRFAAFDASLRALVMSAYGKDCLFLAGGPDWFVSDRYEVEGIIPAGSVSYTPQQFRNGDAPKVQMMLQNLLIKRFKLAVRREVRDTPVYHLVVVNQGKLKPADGPNPPGSSDRQVPTIEGRITIRGFSEMLGGFVGRPVIDKTELTGSYDIRLTWGKASPPPPPGAPEGLREVDQAIFAALQEQLGLKLESARGPVEFLVIEHAEKPTEN